jgi:hypothetical protein
MVVKDLSRRVLSHKYSTRQLSAPAVIRGGADRAASRFPTKLAAGRPGRFFVSTFDEWETFDSRFDDEKALASKEAPKTGRGDAKAKAKAMSASVKPHGMDTRQERYRIRECDTATTCDTSNSSNEEREGAPAIKIGGVRSGVPEAAGAPRRRVPVLLGHILEEKFQQSRRLRLTKTTIDEIGFPLCESSPDSMMLVMKNDDETCSLATTYVRTTAGQWSEIVSL